MSTAKTLPVKPASSFRRAVWRGLGVLLPPLLTIVILLWIGNTVKQYCYDPMMAFAREVLYLRLYDVRIDLQDSTPETPEITTPDGREWVPIDNRHYVPEKVAAAFEEHGVALPRNHAEVYRRYVELEYLNPYIVVPLFLLVLVLVLYLLGRVLAIGVGSFFWGLFEKGVGRLPLVNSVYSSVKQVTDLMFTEREIRYTRIVAVEFPSKGIWSVGFVTSEGMIDVEAAANEPVVNVLIPYAPLPVTGCIITVRKSETIDLNMTVDQALQFIVSCGVVVPPQQISHRTKASLALAGKNGAKLEAPADALAAETPTDAAS
jgi:uncharacterized membrane protein